ncbi:MAG TPA: serpin family protein [Verrucomicrobiae bacterium]|jgi:serpin B|nr:serpin family protein [Verrucomicrobiae bacterium]
MKKLLGGIAICLAAAVASAGDVSGLAQAGNGFAFNLFRQASSGQAVQNIFMSPYSVSVALQMLGNGAAGKTRAEIQGALNTKNLPQDEINGFYKDLNTSLTSQTNVALDLANSIWLNKGFQLKPAFVSTNEAFFGAMLSSVNFETPESADTINRWASDSTRGKINGVVSFPFPANTEVILANAIYFKGEWAEKFDPRLTQPHYFYIGGSMIKQTPMMSRRGKFEYEEGDGFQAVKLPYAGDSLQMILFLPVTNSSPAKLLATFNGKTWNEKILPGFSSREGNLVFPRFRMNSQLLLNQPLKALGMQDAFIPGTANFLNMSSDPLVVSEVLQKSFVDVNEQGTEAAAVTIVTVRATAVMRPLNPFEMIVDRPFFFVISDTSTGAILFMGIVNDPTSQ